ncbi:zonula occludens toxin [Beggiatoa alba B18LD]|uniref:Zonula occludens toxin n=1 Tax=Beggiatoa alba B18LD TaxID=395493 RepID=I3CK66_9GAMM|nr:zonular occludens toxin domain-containing protein [Beggiatoa alba]EIJ44009.1 zonula occludens toxin [Beggiatoa alba B18LD]
MTVHIIAGLAGSGKTNYIVGTLIKDLAKSKRPIYLLNFDLTPEFFEVYPDILELDEKIHRFDGLGDVVAYQNQAFPVVYSESSYGNIRDWLPAGAVLLVDEAQHFFPSERNYRKPPSEFLKYLQTHRHDGHDFYFITQSAQLLDTHIRKHCGAYFRLVRPFGLPYSRLERYSVYASDDKLKPVNKEYGKRVKFDKQAFKLYKSTVVDTVKPRMPFKLFLFIFLIFFIIWLVSSAFGYLGSGDVVVDKTAKEQLQQAKTEGIEKKLTLSEEYILVGGSRFGSNYNYIFAESATCISRRLVDLLAKGHRVQPLDARSVRLNGRILTISACVLQHTNKPTPLINPPLPKL